MKAISIDDGSVFRFNKVERLAKRYNASVMGDIPRGTKTVYVYICPYNEDVCGKRVLKIALTEKQAHEDQRNAADDI